MKGTSREAVLQFLKFGLVGISNTAVSLLVYYVVVLIQPSWYLIGNVLGWAVGVLNSFFWNDRFVFSDGTTSQKARLKKLVRSYAVYGGTLLVSTVLLWIEVELLGLPHTICPPVNLLVTIPLNFLLSKYWAFR